MSTPRRITLSNPFNATVRKSRKCDDAALSITSLLTFPEKDLAGDIVHPQGLDFSLHEANPGVDIEHTGFLIGWARKSLSQAGAPYSLQWGLFDIDGKEHRLPVGTTYFDPNNRISAQAYQLCRDDVLPGVSLEFYPVKGYAKSLGQRSPVDTHRDAMEFTRATVVRWTHCEVPVNQGALIGKSLKQVPTGIDKVLRDNRVGSERLDPILRKALAGFDRRSVTVAVGKAMDPDEKPYDEATTDNDAIPEDMPDNEPDELEDDTTPAQQAGMQLAQGLKDLKALVEDLLTKSEHMGARKKLTKILEGLEYDAEDALAIVEGVKKDLSKGEKEPETEGETEPETEGEEEPEVSTETDDDGYLKCIPQSVRKSIRRFSLVEMQAAVKKAEAADGDSEEDLEELKQEMHRYKRALRMYG